LGVVETAERFPAGQIGGNAERFHAGQMVGLDWLKTNLYEREEALF